MVRISVFNLHIQRAPSDKAKRMGRPHRCLYYASAWLMSISAITSKLFSSVFYCYGFKIIKTPLAFWVDRFFGAKREVIEEELFETGECIFHSTDSTLERGSLGDSRCPPEIHSPSALRVKFVVPASFSQKRSSLGTLSKLRTWPQAEELVVDWYCYVWAYCGQQSRPPCQAECNFLMWFPISLFL